MNLRRKNSCMDFKYVRMWAINKLGTIENEGCKC